MAEQATVSAPAKPMIGPVSTLLPAGGATGNALFTTLAAMCFLASLALGGFEAATGAIANWTARLDAAASIQIRADNPAEIARRTEIVLTLLAETPGVVATRALSQAEIAGLVEPWLGAGNVTPDLPLPGLIDITLDPAAPFDAGALAKRLTAQVEGATLDTHGQWRAQLLRAGNSVRAVAMGILVIVTLTTIAMVSFASRAGLAANYETVEVLHMIGARDAFIAREIQKAFLTLGLKAGAAGAVLAACVLALLALAGGGAGAFAGMLALEPIDFVPLAGVPVIAASVAMAAARWTVLSALRRML